MMADSWPMSRRMVASVREAINGSVTPSIQTRVRRPSPRSSPVILSRAKMRSARANFPKPRATMRESDATWPSWHYPPTPAPCCPAGQEGESLVASPRRHPRHFAAFRAHSHAELRAFHTPRCGPAFATQVGRRQAADETATHAPNVLASLVRPNLLTVAVIQGPRCHANLRGCTHTRSWDREGGLLVGTGGEMCVPTLTCRLAARFPPFDCQHCAVARLRIDAGVVARIGRTRSVDPHLESIAVVNGSCPDDDLDSPRLAR